MNNREMVRAKMGDALRAINEVIAPHETILADDDQYDDPELWWAYPARAHLLEAMAQVESS